VNATSKAGRRGGQVGVAVAGEAVCLRAKARRLWRARVRARAKVRRGGQRQRQRQRQRQKQAPVRARPCFVHVRMRMRGRWTRRWPARASRQGGRLCSGMSRQGMLWMGRRGVSYPVILNTSSPASRRLAPVSPARAGIAASIWYLVPGWKKYIHTLLKVAT
jgi:hypothetical protein